MHFRSIECGIVFKVGDEAFLVKDEDDQDRSRHFLGVCGDESEEERVLNNDIMLLLWSQVFCRLSCLLWLFEEAYKNHSLI